MKLFFFSLLCISSLFAYADTSISGKINVTPGTIEIYTVNWHPQDIQNGVYDEFTWSVTNGTIINQEVNTVTILWNNVPSYLNDIGSVSITSTAVYGAEATLAINLVNYIDGIVETCSGVLGPSAIYENFGTGSNPGPPLTGVSTSYQYISNCVLYPGQYTRTNSTVGCRGQWIGLPQDHTPNDVNGYMLMVDGNEDRGEVYRTTATGLTQAFGYEFSVYVANLANYPAFERPRLQFEIYDLSNNLIQQSNSYRIEYDPSDPWKKISFMFNLPTGITAVQIILVNKNNDESGNDFCVDDISFAPCYPPIIASFSNTIVVDKSSICDNGTVNLYSRWPLPTIPFINPGFKWQKSTNGGSWTDIIGATTMNFIQTESVAGIYEYRMYAYETSNPSQFVVSNIITYYVMKMLVNPRIYNVFNCNPAPVQLVPSFYLQYHDPNLNFFSYTYAWTPATYLSSTTVPHPTISLPPQTPTNINSPAPPPPITYTYNLTIQNTNFGCVGSNTQTVLHYNPRKVVVPTAFTPNGDGVNDLFRPLNLQDYPGGEFWVWDRWGNLIFHSTGPTLAAYSWDGKYSNGQPCEIGTYTWQVTIPGCPNYILNGNGSNNPYGNVVLIR